MKNISDKDAWGENAHAKHFDFMSNEPNGILKNHYESYAEGQFLKKWKPGSIGNTLFEIGCATGEFYRYIYNYRKDLNYYGFDISKPAINRAFEKYPTASFNILNDDLNEMVDKFGKPDAIWCRDVILHQNDPYLMLNQLIDTSQEVLFIRLRTRDKGDTVFDTKLSRQLHWDGFWVPYIVLNINELIKKLEDRNDIKSVIVHRAYDVLGGHNLRLLPEDLYFKSSGTAETALFITKGNLNNNKMDITFQSSPHLDGPSYTIYKRVFQKIHREFYKLLKSTF